MPRTKYKVESIYPLPDFIYHAHCLVFSLYEKRAYLRKQEETGAPNNAGFIRKIQSRELWLLALQGLLALALKQENRPGHDMGEGVRKIP